MFKERINSMKKLRIFLAVLISAVSIVNIFIARASNPGDDDYEERMRRQSEPVYQTPLARKYYFDSVTPEPTRKSIPKNKLYSYLPGITTEQSHSERFWRACDLYSQSTSRRDSFRLDFEAIESHLLPLIKNYFEYHYRIIPKDELKMALNYESFRETSKPIYYINYLKDMFVCLNQEGYSPMSSVLLGFKNDKYYRIILCILEDLPQLPLCPPMLRDCCRCMDELSDELYNR